MSESAIRLKFLTDQAACEAFLLTLRQIRAWPTYHERTSP